jgi:hypothetical protein
MVASRSSVSNEITEVFRFHARQSATIMKFSMHRITSRQDGPAHEQIPIVAADWSPARDEPNRNGTDDARAQ